MADVSVTRDKSIPVNLSPLANFKYDLPAGLVVFLVALPLCLAIALASKAPIFAGVIAGLVGGLVIPLISQSQLSVCGPAAGLTTIVLAASHELGSFKTVLLAVVVGGVLQIILGIARLGTVSYFVPSSVIKAMLAAIGLILIFKQIPHAIGVDLEPEGAEEFQVSETENTFTFLWHSIMGLERGAFLISAVSMAIMIVWDKVDQLRKLTFLPSALIVVVVGTLMNWLFVKTGVPIALQQEHLVTLPPMDGIHGFVGQFSLPAFSEITNSKVFTVGLEIGLVASLETLLCIEAVDKLDPFKRPTPMDRELIAQGIGNITSGLLGGLPVTSVIVRSSANINAGARTKTAAFFHGVFLLLAILFISQFLNMIPVACLASILLMTGYKLAKPELFKKMWKLGWDQFIPFAFTILAILFTDLLKGVIAGLVVGIIFVLRTNMRAAFTVIKEGKKRVISFKKDVSFINKAALSRLLKRMPNGASVIIDGTASEFIDYDIVELIDDFQVLAKLRGIDLELRGIKAGGKPKVAPSVAPIATGHAGTAGAQS